MESGDRQSALADVSQSLTYPSDGRTNNKARAALAPHVCAGLVVGAGLALIEVACSSNDLDGGLHFSVACADHGWLVMEIFVCIVFFPSFPSLHCCES
jgi:hypothetical protein